MKPTYTQLSTQEKWNRHKQKLQHFFTWLTGYEIMFGGSKKDLVPEIPRK